MPTRPEYPTSIRLTQTDKRRLRKHASRWQLSLAGLIQMVLLQWLEKNDFFDENSKAGSEESKRQGK